MIVGNTIATDGLPLVVQLVIQFGALGLLGFIVWQLPKLITELRVWRQSSEVAHREERDSLKLERNELLAAYRQEAKYEREYCASNFKTVSDNTLEVLGKLESVVDKIDHLSTQMTEVRSLIIRTDNVQIVSQPRQLPTSPSGG